jgi:hypothetical protein
MYTSVLKKEMSAATSNRITDNDANFALKRLLTLPVLIEPVANMSLNAGGTLGYIKQAALSDFLNSYALK